MMTKTLRKTLIATGFVAAFGFSAGQAMAHDSAMAAPAHGAWIGQHADTSMGQKVSDTWITTKVKSEFATTKGVPMTEISVDTKDGVVMLTGKIGSQAEKEMAVRTARSVKGVKAVQADKLDVGAVNDDDDMDNDAGTSMGQKVSDTWITTKVKSEFATTEGVPMTDVSVDTKDGVVMLTGTVDSDAERQMAIQHAKSVKGVKAVEADKLKVGKDDDAMDHDNDATDQDEHADASMGQKISDSWITTKVKSEFAVAKGVDMDDVSVDTKDGVVILTGTVDSDAERALAIKHAKSVKGVKAVQADKLKVDTDKDAADASVSQKASDTWISTKVKSEFATTSGVGVTHITVDTRDGVVHLSGSVKTEAEKQLAVKTARSVKGVKSVEADTLNVGSE